MERYNSHEEIELIHGYYLPKLPQVFRELIDNRIGVHFVVNQNPNYIGLIPSERNTTQDGRVISSVSLVNYSCSQDHLPAIRRRTTVILQNDIKDEEIFWHEIGHVLHETVDWPIISSVELDDYAATNIWERFATVFQSYMTLRLDSDYWYYHTRDYLFKHDIDSYKFFEGLEKGV